ncbi:AAA family ATPase [Almyronema epifaneia]|uniref:AAA family ATPase n=1 Tax=Almyronema epifaneia S1 TaxID=2991925 RepID=A0ABW6IAJ7_9CYAN
MDLFDQHRQQLIEQEAPLAARMRPRSLDEFVGQDAIIGPGRLLRRAVQADQLASLIFYGPPGTGKTTLARVIANTTQAHFIAINAVLSGVKEIREAIALAQAKRGQYSQRTILFVDEVHRFNKAQQDALLPWVENGTVILIGATTENPFFEVNKALVSRSRIFQLKPLTTADLKQVAAQALSDRDRGYGHKSVVLEPEALDHLVNVANGDARTLLNALELAVETTPADTDGKIHVTLAVAEDSIQQRAVLYDKEGDAHFDTISAFIKSVRGSDADAALYWLAQMVYAGEDPRFIFRRLLILASEDVGLADPQAITVVSSCAMAFDRVGMPEGRYPLAQATLYLATAPKSNSVMGFFDALATVEQAQQPAVPNPMRDASRDKKGLGHGQGYLYPHAYRDHWVAQQYLPTSLQGQVFYQPSNQGYEGTLQTQVSRRREAQLAALTGAELPEMLTYSPPDLLPDRWLQRSLAQAGERLAQVRDRLFELAQLQRHHLVLDLNAASGLLTWEALRQAPEGGVYALAYKAADAEALQEQGQALPDLTRPTVLLAQPSAPFAALSQPALTFDRIIGRNVWAHLSDRAHFLPQVVQWLAPEGRLVLVDNLPQAGQRLYQLLTPAGLAPELYQALAAAETALYQNEPDLATLQADLIEACKRVGLKATTEILPAPIELYLSAPMLQRWFQPGSKARPSYSDRLRPWLSAAEMATVQAVFKQQLLNQTLTWHSQLIFLQAQIVG